MIYCAACLGASLPLTLLALCAHKKGEDSECLQDHIICFPEIKTLAELIIGLCFVVVSAASQASLAWEDFSRGLGLMIMTPLFMNCFFGHPPSESALYDF